MIEGYSLRYYPIALRLQDAKALVIGGGCVAQRKVMYLLNAGAYVHVVSPKMTRSLKRLVKEDRIEWTQRQVCRNDLSYADIVISATNNIGVNKTVSRWAQEWNIWVNVVDNSGLSNFISPAVFRCKKGIVAVYTDARDPVLSRDLKNFLKERWDDFLSYRNRLQKDST